MINTAWNKLVPGALVAGALFIGVLLMACKKAENKKDGSQVEISTAVALDYASGFKILKSGDISLVVIKNTKIGLTDSLTYALIPSGKALPDLLNADQVIEVPVKKLVVTSTSHVPFLDLLGVPEYLVGFPNTDYISSESMRERIDQNLIRDVGDVNGLDFESLIELRPELVMSYVSGPDQGELEQLNLSGIPTVVNLDFMEESPLGRAEWIKFMGLMVGKFSRADSVFREIERKYQQLQTLTSSAIDNPTVFSGIIYGDTWFAPGGSSFIARFIEDAGGIYTWSDYPETGSIELSFEAIIDRNSNTDFWIGSGGFTTKADLWSADPRYANFQAFKRGQVYNYHGRIGATGGFEYLESGGARPDLVLSDFIKILHPQLADDRDFYFFKELD